MMRFCKLALGVALVSLVVGASAQVQNFVDVKPSPQQVEWQDLEFGVILHFSTNTFLNREWGDGTASPSVFNPTQFDPDQWMQAIKASGAKYVVLVAKHHDGFCLWPTGQTDYSVKASPWENGKGDVVGDVARAARKYGLKFGIYLSPWDRHDPRYQDSAAYDKYYLAELEEDAQVQRSPHREPWPAGREILYVVDSRQALHFKNLFAIAHENRIRIFTLVSSPLNML